MFFLRLFVYCHRGLKIFTFKKLKFEKITADEVVY